jgi:hypothetical protein
MVQDLRFSAAVMKSSIFWDIKPCSPLKANGRFGGTCLHLPGSACYLLHADFLLGLFFCPEDGDDVISQRTELFSE